MIKKRKEKILWKYVDETWDNQIVRACYFEAQGWIHQWQAQHVKKEWNGETRGIVVFPFFFNSWEADWGYNFKQNSERFEHY